MVATAIMLDQEIRTASIHFPSEDVQIRAYLAEPVGAGPFPAVIVFQEIFGVNVHIRDITERIAKEGYVAIAPHLYQRIGPDFESGYTPEDIQIGKQYKAQTVAAELLSDTRAAIVYLQSLPRVQAGSIGAIGFCFGGHVAYLAATLPEITATASFYGAGISTWTPGGGPPTLSRTAEIKGIIYAFFGTQDKSIPTKEVQQIQTELEKHSIRHRIFHYPGEHGFFCDQRASYDPEAAVDAWNHVKQLFQKNLTSPKQ
ncbi:Candidate 1: dienelactone hydrolase [uncultured Synechococcales cyanobacterium]|uniref:Candidate 1: dienelactone hydrolase n=1 Tax=uncultured Synechococcales cyanobacterium TaxID=1936017 RepID=A0A6J4VYK1_9CYAN|nr:Candidate 1: dienelactone hydrolase [uncultured Synechococcales cyanobacterium]